MHRSVLLWLFAPALVGAQHMRDAEPRLASKEQYAACLDAEVELERDRSAVARRQDELKRLSAKFRAADDKFNAQVRLHAPGTKAEINSYNRAVEVRNQHVNKFNERSRVLQRDQGQLNTRVAEHNTTCGSLVVDAETKNAVAQERKNRVAKQ